MNQRGDQKAISFTTELYAKRTALLTPVLGDMLDPLRPPHVVPPLYPPQRGAGAYPPPLAEALPSNALSISWKSVSFCPTGAIVQCLASHNVFRAAR